MDIFKSSLLILGLLAGYYTHGQEASQLVYMDQGSLTYVPFSMEGQTNEVNTIPDFSHAGYMGGGVALPIDVPVRITVTPTEGDDAPQIQEAINYVQGLEPDDDGFRGAVLVKAGHYSLENILVIRESGVVLRGEGQGLNGTVLHANPRLEHSVVSIVGQGGIIKAPASTQAIVADYVPVGSRSFEVQDASGYQIGDKIVVTRTPNQQWIDDLGMDQESLCGGSTGCTGWTPGSYTIDHERTIVGIADNTINVDIPIVDVMEEQYGGGTISKIESSRRISRCAVENMRIQSFYTGTTDEAHAWTAVRLKDAEHCWVRQVTGQYLAYSTVNIDDANFTTVEDCAYIDPVSQVSGGRRYSFAIQEGIGNLFQRCYATTGRHDFVTGSRVTGPNVFLDGLAESARSDIGPHHRWATGTLFDNLKGGSTRVWNRGSSGTGHGWSGAQTMFWNITSYTGEFRVDSPLGSRNWGIGCRGSNQTGAGYWEAWGAAVQPRSLYLQQLEDRLGDIAVSNVVISQQRTGEIYDLLAAWAGEGNLTDGGFVGEVPAVSFVSPATTIDVTVWDGSDIEIEATDADGTIESVKLLINGEPVGFDNEKPYIFTDVATTIRELSHELHYLQVIATDDDGNTAHSRLAILGGDPPEPMEDEEEEEEEELPTKVTIFPSPLLGQPLNISMTADGLYTVRMYDAWGKKTAQFDFEGAQYEHDCDGMTAGIYFVEISSADELLFTGKLLII